MVVIVGVTLTFSLYLVSKINRYLIASFLLLTLFLVLNLESYIKNANAKEFIVFNISKKSLISFRLGNRLLFVDVDTSKDTFAEKYNFFAKGYISSVGVAKDYDIVNPFLKEKVNRRTLFLKVKNQHGVTVISFVNKTFIIPYDKSLDKYKGNSRYDVDYLIVNKYYSRKVFSFFKPKMVILDSSVDKRVFKDIILQCRKENIPSYATSSQGAYVLNTDDV